MMLASVPSIFFPAPYGKFNKGLDGKVPFLLKQVNCKFAFMISESPAILTPLYMTYNYWGMYDGLCLAFVIFYELHYIHRLIIYPHWRVRSQTTCALLIPIASFAFQSINAYVMTKYCFAMVYSILTDLDFGRLYAGAVLFAVGMFFNIVSDHL